jgi:hypothetical protein
MLGVQCLKYFVVNAMDISEFLVLAGGNIRCIRCTAMSKRTKLQCARPALAASTTQKCQFHGGRGSGPKTAEGKARIGAAHFKHGHETNQNRLERSQASLRLAQLEDLMYVLDMTSAARTPGRKPGGYRKIRTYEEAGMFIASQVLHHDKGLKED